MTERLRSTDVWLAIALIVAALVLVPSMWLMGASGTGMMGGTSWMGGGWILGMGVAVVVVVILVLLFLTLGAGPPAIPPPVEYPVPVLPGTGMTAIQILDARYARGEISRDEYLRIRQDIQPRNP